MNEHTYPTLPIKDFHRHIDTNPSNASGFKYKISLPQDST